MLLVSQLFLIDTSFAQGSALEGIVLDSYSKEPISFASVYLKKSSYGKTTDTLGKFLFNYEKYSSDTLVVSYIGYETYSLPLKKVDISKPLRVLLERNGKNGEVVVKLKINKGLFVWKKIMAKKKYFDKSRQTNYAYESYNKIELDIKNINPDKWRHNPLLKPFSFVFDNMDSSTDEKPFLPAYLVESLSDFAYQKSPRRFYEYKKAVNMKGIENESIADYIGAMRYNINIFDNFIDIFGKEFVSPFNDNGDLFYNFSIADTQIIGTDRIFHFIFKPKRVGENTFDGEAWVKAGSFQLTKISFFLGKDVNINYFSRLCIFQEFIKLNDTLFFTKKEKFFADFSPLGKNVITLIARKTASYKNIVVNSDSITKRLADQHIERVIESSPDTLNKTDADWALLRHDTLSSNEQKIYHTVDKLLAMPAFKRLQKVPRFLFSGIVDVGYFTFGPWFQAFSRNDYEGYKYRFDIANNRSLFKNVYLHSYIAFCNQQPQEPKWLAEVTWIPSRKPKWIQLHASVSHDIDGGITNIGELSQNNIFSLAIRKPGIQQKLLDVKDARFDVYNEWGAGLATHLFVTHRHFMPVLNLPTLDSYVTDVGDMMTSVAVSLKVRFAYLEQFIERPYSRYSLKTKYPITEVTFTKGFKNILNSAYDYYKVNASITDNLKLSPFGQLNYNVYAGYVNGTLPFVLLENHTGNDLMYYNKNALNLIRRFQLLSDKYVGVNLEHQLGSGIFRYFVVTRKLQWRQFWTLKSVWGHLNDDNVAYNGGDTYFKNLNRNFYAEIGTGIDNIFDYFRLDCIWNISPDASNYEASSRFGVFASFRFDF